MRKLLLILLCLILVGCGTVEVETREMPTPSPTPTAVASNSKFVASSSKSAPTPTPIPTAEPTPIPTPEPTAQPVYSAPSYTPSYTPTYDPIANDPLYAEAGRFYIPSVGIDVGLAQGCESQAITDRADTAWFQEYNFWSGDTTHVIADHDNQDFANLTGVSVGDEAVIENPDGTTTTLVCKEVLDAYNRGDIVTADGRCLDSEAGNYVVYTCHGDGVRACVFVEVIE